MIDDPQVEPFDTIPVEPSEEAIRLRSKLIWEREGCPEGLAQAHWDRAKAELEAEKEHWMRAKAELAAEMEKTSTAQLAAPASPKNDFLRSVFVQASTLMPKTLVLAGPYSPLPAKRPKPTTAAPSIICADIAVHGELESTGEIQLDGFVEGDVRSAALVVGDEGVIHGEVMADDVTVRGRVRGNIRARKVHLGAKSHVDGDILYGIFSADPGAQIEGHCRHVNDPLSQEIAPAAGVPEEPVEAPSEELARTAA